MERKRDLPPDNAVAEALSAISQLVSHDSGTGTALSEASDDLDETIDRLDRLRDSGPAQPDNSAESDQRLTEFVDTVVGLASFGRARSASGGDDIIGQMAPGLKALGKSLLTSELEQSQEEQRRLAQENSVIAEIGRIISSSLDINEVYERFVEEVKKLVSFDRIYITLVDRDQDKLETKYVSGIKIQDWDDVPNVPLSSTVADVVTRTRSGLMLQRQDADEPIYLHPNLVRARRVGLNSILLVPLISRGIVIGTLGCFSTRLNAYTERDLALIQSVADQIAGAVANAQIHSGLKKSDKALRANEERLKILFEYAPDAYYLSDLKGTFIDGNRAAEELSGYNREELIGENFLKLKLLPLSQIPRAGALLVKNALGQPTGPDLFRFNRKDGSQVELEISSHPVKIQGKHLVLGMARDLTKRRQAEKALQESEERYRELVEDASLVVFSADSRGYFTYVNPRVIQLTGYSEQVIIGKHFTFLVEQTWKARVRRFYLKQLVKRSSDTTLEFPIPTRSGDVKWVEQSVAIISTREEVTGFQAIVRDITERKLAEEALRRAEDKYRSIFENAVWGIFQTTPEGRFISANNSLARILGYESPEELLKEVGDIGNQVHTDPNRRAEFARLLDEEGSVLGFEAQARRKDGSLIWISLTARAIHDADGNVTSHEGVLDDITERKRIEEALRDSEQHHRTLLESYPDAVSLVVDGRIVYVNPVMCDMTGYAADEIRGRPVGDFVAPDHRARAEERVHALTEGAPQFPSEYNLIGKKGDLVPVEITSRQIQYQGGPALLSVSRDITERKRAERALQQAKAELEQRVEERTADLRGAVLQQELEIAERRLAEAALLGSETRNRAILEAIPDLMFRIRGDGAFLDYVASEELLALPPEKWLDRKISDVMPEGFANTVMFYIKQSLQTGEMQIFEYQLAVPIPDGELRDLEARTVVSGEDEVLIITRDVTERKQLEQQLLQAQKMDAIGQLAGGVAHDFNNLLSVIMGYAQFGLIERSLDPTIRGHLQHIETAADRAAKLTHQLLAFSRRQIMAPKVVDLNEQVMNLDKMLRRLIGEHVEMVLLRAPDLGRVKVDPGQMDQVLVNLAVNARDAMPDGGRLIIETAEVTLGEDYVSRNTDATAGEHVVLRVTDNGSGMTEDVKAHIFEHFFTTKGIRRRDRPGSLDELRHYCAEWGPHRRRIYTGRGHLVYGLSAES